MSHFFIVLMMIAMGAVVLSLVIGVVSMVRGGEFNQKYGNQLMRWRVSLQGLALLCFAIAMMTGKSSQ